MCSSNLCEFTSILLHELNKKISVRSTYFKCQNKNWILYFLIYSGGIFILLHSLIVKNFPDISGWHRSTCLDKLDVGELLWDLTILVERHKLHLNCKLKPLFFPLSDANRLKNSEKWSNLCLNLASCSSSATILLQKNVLVIILFLKNKLVFN